jgi:DNA-directed RNA polymerase specialized sigma24 family protein
LSPAELPYAQSDEAAASPRNDSTEKDLNEGDFRLTKDAFEKLLNHFSPDREEAVRLYLAMRLRLTRYFEWQSCFPAELQVDKTLDRVARKIDEGAAIVNLTAYSLQVARFVCKEWRRENRPLTELESIPEMATEPPTEDEQKEARLSCLDDCLDKLSIESRNLILGYYSGEGRAKIDRRIKIAEALGIPLNALRIRAHRIRNTLEECLKECLGTETKMAQRHSK